MSQKGFAPIIILLIITVSALGAYFAYQSSKAKLSSVPSTPITTSKKLAPRSKAPGMATQIILTKTIDPKTGLATSPASTFSKKDPTIYSVVALNNPSLGTKVEYVRYLNGKFLDNRNATTTKASDKNIIFDWKLNKPGATRLSGVYKVKIYTNGVFEKEVNYTVE